ncbi:MAG TPA: YicC family protein [Clostridiaceae bacterium]|jgi:uncharacterized protein (TIGR00255 family)|nr:YicC family protein [Clostridiaceae bacterium]HOA30422.1 YicC family protein [Clostridia bacterium]
MLRSMTGFGRGEYSDGERRFIVEIKTVNHRYIDINVRMPRDLISLEEKIHKLVKKHITRGKVDIFITSYNIKTQQNTVVLNEDLIVSLLESMKALSEKFGLDNDVTTSTILQFPESYTIVYDEVDTEKIWEILGVACEQALLNVVEMREKEGSAISKNLLDILANMEKCFAEIKEKSPQVPIEYKKKLEQRLDELLTQPVDMIDERIAIEVALFADKCNIDEEIARLDSHITQGRNILSDGGVAGRTLDFLVQEMNREVNTIGSKTNSIEITENVIALKSEIEKFREQIQNIE